MHLTPALLERWIRHGSDAHYLDRHATPEEAAVFPALTDLQADLQLVLLHPVTDTFILDTLRRLKALLPTPQLAARFIEHVGSVSNPTPRKAGLFARFF